jgi:RimJ/RimL family protein N-acetyltransferase
MSTHTETPHSHHVLALNSRTTALRPCAVARDQLVLADGTHLRFRPLGPGDRDGLAALFDRLSFESRRRRFLSPKHELTARELTYFTEIDHVGHEAIAAVDQHDDCIVGVARYVSYPDRAGVAELAVEVADELHGMRIGSELARRLLDRARANGITLLTATTLWENLPARALLRRLRFRPRLSHRGVIELELHLEPRRLPTSLRDHRRTASPCPRSRDDSAASTMTERTAT